MTNKNLLNLLQLASPALPVGAISYSEGLEILMVLTLEFVLSAVFAYGKFRAYYEPSLSQCLQLTVH